LLKSYVSLATLQSHQQASRDLHTAILRGAPEVLANILLADLEQGEDQTSVEINHNAWHDTLSYESTHYRAYLSQMLAPEER
jgi:hypothetical protein